MREFLTPTVASYTDWFQQVLNTSGVAGLFDAWVSFKVSHNKDFGHIDAYQISEIVI